MVKPIQSFDPNLVVADQNFRELRQRIEALERRLTTQESMSGERVISIVNSQLRMRFPTDPGTLEINDLVTDVGTVSTPGTSKKASRSSHVHKDYQKDQIAYYSTAVINLGTSDDGGSWSNVDGTNAVITVSQLPAGDYRVWFQFPWHAKFQDAVLGKYVGCVFGVYDGTDRRVCNEVRLLSMAGSWDEEIIIPIFLEAHFTYGTAQSSLTWSLQKTAVIDAATVNYHEILCDNTNGRCLAKGYQWA